MIIKLITMMSSIFQSSHKWCDHCIPHHHQILSQLKTSTTLSNRHLHHSHIQQINQPSAKENSLCSPQKQSTKTHRPVTQKNQESQHKAIYTSTTHHPTNPSLIEKIHQLHSVQKLYLITHRATTIQNPQRTAEVNQMVQIWKLGDKIAFPLSDHLGR